MDTAKKEIYVFGHKNPDTDSICSAIAYAWLKNQIGAQARDSFASLTAQAYAQEQQPDTVYVPRRAGQLGPETEYLLKRFTPQPRSTLTTCGFRSVILISGKLTALRRLSH